MTVIESLGNIGPDSNDDERDVATVESHGCALNRQIWKKSGRCSISSLAMVSEQPKSSFDFSRSH
jgi:hypothetical protein